MDNPLNAQLGPSDGMAEPWLSIIGIGEDGLDGLTNVARALIATAEVVYGGRRHLGLAEDAINGETKIWQNPLDASIAEIRGQRGRRIAVLASGDPFEHGIGVTLSRYLARDEWVSVPGISSFSWAANRLGWALQDIHRIGLNGRALERLIPLVHRGQRILALSTDETTPRLVAELLTARGFGLSRLHVLEALGGGDEQIRLRFAADYDLDDVNPLNLLGIEVDGPSSAFAIPRAPGLPDHAFQSDGQLTKREIRAVTLSTLSPCPGQHLWDLGAGSGSISIEWMLADPSCRATAVEVRPDRASTIAHNALALGVPGLRVITGDALGMIPELSPPDVIFIGGGASDPALIEAAFQALPKGGRLVVNAVTLETQSQLIAEYSARGGELTRIAIDRAGTVGGYLVFRPALPVVQWCVVKT